MVARTPLGPNTASRREGQTSYKVEKMDMESPAFQGFIFNRLLVRKQTVGENAWVKLGYFGTGAQ